MLRFALGILYFSTFALSIPLDKLLQNKSILAIGDSLTHGYLVDRRKFSHSYVIQLSKKLENLSVDVVEAGVNGQRAMNMVHTAPTLITGKMNGHLPLKVVIIMAGTNDLASNTDVDSISTALIRIHNIVQRYSIQIKQNIYTICVAVPQLKIPMLQQKRNRLNLLLNEYANRCSHVVGWLDFEDALDQSIDSNLKYWGSDKLHFSELGYDKIGEIMYETLVDFANNKTMDSLYSLEANILCL